MTFIIISLIVALLGGIVTLFFSSEMVGELYTTVFDCGQYLTTVSGVEFFSLLMPVSYGFGISLIILKFLKKAFDIYVLWTDGDPDADPFLLLTNFVRAVGTALIFQWLYGLFVDNKHDNFPDKRRYGHDHRVGHCDNQHGNSSGDCRAYLRYLLADTLLFVHGEGH